MRELERRLRRLAGQQPRRCAVCLDRKPWVIRWEREADEADEQYAAWFAREHPEPSLEELAPCSGCGWEPGIIRVVYVRNSLRREG